MVTMGSEIFFLWKLNMILILISTRIENVQWHEFKCGFKIQCVKTSLNETLHDAYGNIMPISSYDFDQGL